MSDPISGLNIGQTRIGVDEAGKGDVFGPLVVAGVIVTPEVEDWLAKHGVRDGKQLSRGRVAELAQLVQVSCPVETLILQPPDYNVAYKEHGRNLNRLLAWGHARVISRLSRCMPVAKAISDQFGNPNLLIQALAAEGCQIPLEQHPQAERDLAVAAASVVARAAFIGAIEKFTCQLQLDIPLGASAGQVKEVGKYIYRRWGRQGLEQIAKMHFKTVREIITEVDNDRRSTFSL